MTCADCKFLKRIARPGETPQCRRYPPVGASEWPVVKSDDWCGEFSPIQNRKGFV